MKKINENNALKSIKESNQKMGVTVNGSLASFKMWSPLASNVELLLFNISNLNNPIETKKMLRNENGFWTINDISFGANNYYKYRIHNDKNVFDVSDIWSYAASPDSIASQIVDISKESWEETEYTNPWNGEDYRDAVIYEMHIRDWSRAIVQDSTGKFLDIANSSEIINHLKDLGITHVQILPMFDYAQTNDDLSYNWGYNPYHYNVPEGRYVKDMKDGTDAVKQMRQMIKTLHDNGIAVIMDVVYNHTNGTKENSLYDMTIPEYFYRITNGNYSDGSGCGNEVATNHKMVKYYVIESLKHWMNDYHINGFRFDLMGCQEEAMMKEIYETLYDIDNKVMIYGEPWTGGISAVQNGCTGAVSTDKGYGVGAFDDDFRDAIKGAEFGGFKHGVVQGTFKDGERNNDEGIIKGLQGLSGNNNRNKVGKVGLSLHYVECHDNFTLFDKLALSKLGLTNPSKDKLDLVKALGNDFEQVKAQDKLAAAFVLLSQGTPFINGGQEFLRTKKGNPDSYSADTKGGITWTNEQGKFNIDDVNTIDLSMKTKHADVYNTYKALISIRKNIEVFRKGSSVNAENIKEGITKYTTGNYVVYFNATEEDFTCSDSGKKFTINEQDGTYSISSTKEELGSIPSKSFVIFEK